MASIILPSQHLVLRAFSSLVDLAPGYNAYSEHLNYVSANGEAAYKAALNSAFAGQTNAQLASAMLSNLGLTSVFTQAEGEAYLAANASNRVGAIIDLANALATYAGTDAGLLTAKSNYNAALDYSYTYSIERTNPGTVELTDSRVNTVELTSNSDVKTANIFNAAQVYTPGGDDRINSLQDEDQLTGTGTNSTLNATLGNANDNGATIITPKLNGVSIINTAFTGSGGGAVTALDLQDATGQTAVNITRISQASNVAEVGNLMTAAASLSLANTNANQAGVAEFSYGTNVLQGANTGSLALNNVQIGAVNVGENTSGIAARGVSTNGFENLTLNSTGANTIGTLNLPMDTNTTGTLAITGSGSLRLGNMVDVFNRGNNTLVEADDVYVAATGVAQAGGRLAAIDASAFTGNLTLVLDNLLDVGKAGTSGVNQDVTVTGGSGNDTFVLYDAVQAGDSINGGAGNDNLLFYSGSTLASVASNFEVTSMLADGSTGNIALDYDFTPNATGMTVRNISADYIIDPVNGVDNDGDGAVDEQIAIDNPEAAVTFTMYDMSAAQAAAITIQHATTGNGQVLNNNVEVALKANTAADTVGVTIAEGTNTDPRFNFTLDTVVANTATSTTASASTFENVTITDSDSESNTVLLANVAQHTGTITLTGGRAGTFLNLDADTATANGTDNGFRNLAVDGTATDNTNTFGTEEFGATASQVRIVAATVNAANEASNVHLRVSSTAANTNGGQSITMGSGNDTVVFDDVAVASATRGTAGLTNADTVAGGTGADTLVLDGDGINVIVQQSEWDNVSGFETIALAGNAGFQYFLQLDNDMIVANGVNANMITIDNDDDSAVSAVTNVDNDVENTAVRIDGTNLSANVHFTYDGEEGTGATTDRFVLNDQNTNGGNFIDGGEANISNNLVAGVASDDVIEVRNTATVTTSDLANVRNVGNIVINNDQAVLQTLNLVLNDSTVDLLVDAGHGATVIQNEVLTITANDGLMTDAAGNNLVTVAGSALNINATNVSSGANGLTINGDALIGANDTVQISGRVAGAAHTIDLAIGTADALVVWGTSTTVALNTGAGTLQYTTGVSTLTDTIANIESFNFSNYVGALTVTGSATAETFVGTTGADTITGGAGADNIRLGAGADRVVIAANGDSGPSAAAALAAAQATATMDVVTDIANGDSISLAGLANADLNALVALGATGAAALGADDTIHVTRGTYASVAGVMTFTAGVAGTDAMVVYDVDATNATLDLEAIVLVGGWSAVADGVTVAGGIITL